MKHFTFYILTFCFTACQLFQTQHPVAQNTPAQDKEEEVFMPVEKELYVIKEEGAAQYKTLNEIADKYAYLFGEKISIIAEGKEFYKTIREDYIRKENLGTWETLKAQITNETLVKDIDNNGNSNDNISKYLTITQISYKEYQEALKNKIDFLTEDTLAIVKKKGKLTFPCKHKTVYLKDQINDDNNPFTTTYQYLGNIPVLNQYVVFEDSEDFYSYIFIDNNTGNKTVFERFPFLSPDKKYIITIGRAYEDLIGIISLYRIKSINPFKVETLVDENTKWWAAYDFDKESIFFSKNGYLYAPMNVIPNFFDENNHLNPQRMYIKIKIK